ncbi:hypothetical protein GDO81_020589 [Engystomops pustulosus]|uniref:Secreted protein n=1 Tax=Engystomops pustulosus TaxID=76066 RepID=A0AAV6ZE41_ENGPU|nr:hypothetical protein GDO81_020589 [Engystomops pustulosus]
MSCDPARRIMFTASCSIALIGSDCTRAALLRVCLVLMGGGSGGESSISTFVCESVPCASSTKDVWLCSIVWSSVSRCSCACPLVFFGMFP